jgi:signal transduction histidine kinase
MNERVRLLGGQLEIQSALGAGAKVVVTVPLTARS